MYQADNYRIERHKSAQTESLPKARQGSGRGRRRRRAQMSRSSCESVLLSLFISYYLCSCAVVIVRASGVFELELIKLDSDLATNRAIGSGLEVAASNTTASNHVSAPTQDQLNTNQQLKRVFVCLKEPFTSNLDGPCTFGNASILVKSTGHRQDSNSTTAHSSEQQQQQGSLLTNIVRIPITFKWTVSMRWLSLEFRALLVVKWISVESSM